MSSSTFIDRLFTRLLRISRMNRGSLGSSVWIINPTIRVLIIWVTRVFYLSSMYSFPDMIKL